MVRLCRHGRLPKANVAALPALKLNPGSGNNVVSLAFSYQWINQLDHTKATAKESRAHGIDLPWLPPGSLRSTFPPARLGRNATAGRHRDRKTRSR